MAAVKINTNVYRKKILSQYLQKKKFKSLSFGCNVTASVVVYYVFFKYHRFYSLSRLKFILLPVLGPHCRPSPYPAADTKLLMTAGKGGHDSGCS